jgi:hypothetical protein
MLAGVSLSVESVDLPLLRFSNPPALAEIKYTNVEVSSDPLSELNTTIFLN